MNKRKVGKGGEVNRNEGLHSLLRGRLNRLVRRAHKGLLQYGWMLTLSIALAGLKLGWI